MSAPRTASERPYIGEESTTEPPSSANAPSTAGMHGHTLDDTHHDMPVRCMTLPRGYSVMQRPPILLVFSLLVALALGARTTTAQTRTVTGTVTDVESGEPIRGAQISVR